MNQKELLLKKEEELKKIVEQYNLGAQQIQKIQQAQNELGQEILRLDGAIKALKELETKNE